MIADAVQKGADVNYHHEGTGRTPLTFACEYGIFVRYECVVELLRLGADVNSMNDMRKTALSLASERGLHRIVDLLLSKVMYYYY